MMLSAIYRQYTVSPRIMTDEIETGTKFQHVLLPTPPPTHTHLALLLVDLTGPGLQKFAERGFGLAKSKNLTFDYSREALAPVGMCGKVCW